MTSSTRIVRDLPPFVSMMDTLVRRLCNTLAAVAGFSLFLMMVQTVADVVTKYFFNVPIQGNLEIVSYFYMTAVVFLPLAITEMKYEHISVDMVVRILPVRTQSYLYAFTATIAAGFFVLLTWQTLQDALKSTEQREIMMGTALIAVWPAKWILPFGFGVGVLAFCNNAVIAAIKPDQFNSAPETDIILVD